MHQGGRIVGSGSFMKFLDFYYRYDLLYSNLPGDSLNKMMRIAAIQQLKRFHIAHDFLHAVFMHVSVSTMNLNGVDGDFKSGVCTIYFGQSRHRRGKREIQLRGIKQLGISGTAGGDLQQHVAKHPLEVVHLVDSFPSWIAKSHRGRS